MLSALIGKGLYWLAQGAIPMGRPGARAAHWLLGQAQLFDPKLIRARGWQHLIEGSFARRRGDLEEAARLLREAGSILPDNDAVIANLGLTLAMSGQCDEAIQIIERAIRGEMDITGEPQVWVALAWSYLRSGRAPKAVDACDRAAESHAASLDTEVLRLLAQGSQHGIVRRADLERLLKARPRMLPLVLEFAQAQAAKGAHHTAKEVMRALPERVQPGAFHAIARSALNEDDINTAAWALKLLRVRDPSSPIPAMLRSDIALRQGHPDAALRHAEDAVTAGRRKADAFEQLARAHVVRGEWDEAVEAAAEAVTRQGAGALATGVAALALLNKGAVEEARKLFVKQRTGDTLACVFAHSAQAVILAAEDETVEALRLGAAAVQEIAELPSWALRRPVIQQPADALDHAFEIVGEEANEAMQSLRDVMDRAAVEVATEADGGPDGAD